MSVRSVGVNINLNRVNYIEWLDVSHYQDEFFEYGEFNTHVALVSAGFVYNQDDKFVTSALTYTENNKTTGLIHIPQNMIIHKREVILKPLKNLASLKKVELEKGEVYVVKVVYVDASKSYQVPNGVMPPSGITCYTCGILTNVGAGIVTVVQDWSPQSNSFREIYNIPEVCIKEIHGVKQKLTKSTLKLIEK